MVVHWMAGTFPFSNKQTHEKYSWLYIHTYIYIPLHAHNISL